MKKLFLMILAALFLLPALAMAEDAEAVTHVNSFIDEGSFVIQIEVPDGDLGWQAADMSQDDSVVVLAYSDVLEDTFVARYDAVGDGDMTVCVRHMNSLACDKALTWDLHVQDGAVQEVLSGSHTESPDEMEQDPYISGEWLVNDDIMAGLTIAKNDGQGWSLQIATAYPNVCVFQADMAYDCELDKFVYSNGTVYQSEITESPEIVLGEVLETDVCGTLGFVEVNGELRLEWYNELSPEETAIFYRPDGWEEENGMAEGADSDWYMAVLTDPDIAAEYPYHCFADINGNGVPVLVVSTTEDAFFGEEDQGCVYLYDAGEPRLVMTVGGNAGEKLFGNADTHTLTYYSRMSGEEHIEVYAVEEGALALITRADRYQPGHGPAESGAEELFLQDDAEISRDEGEALFAEYAADEDALTYEAADDEAAELANPWVELTEEELQQEAGIAFGVPEGAEDVVYRWLASEGLAEMQFTLDGDEYCARVQPAALEDGELMNISGMYFDWENEESVTIGHCYGTIGQAQTGSEEWVELCQWYDAAPGLMYSLSVYTTELDGLDLTAVAEMVYVPMQGDD